MAIAATGSNNNAGNQTTGTVFSFTVLGANVAVGDVVVVWIAADNAGTAGANSITSVTDTSGNTYTQLRLQNRTAASAAADGCTAAIYATKVTTGLTAGSSTITVNFSPTTVAKAAAYLAFSGVGTIASFYAGNASSGTGTTYTSNASASITSGDLVLGVAANESTTPPGADGDTTLGSWVENTATSSGTGGDATKMALRFGYKITTGTGAQTYNGATGVSTDWAACIVALPATPPPPWQDFAAIKARRR